MSKQFISLTRENHRARHRGAFTCIKDLVMEDSEEIAATNYQVYEFELIDGEFSFIDDQLEKHYMEDEDMKEYFSSSVPNYLQNIIEKIDYLIDKERIKCGARLTGLLAAREIIRNETSL